jgi:two-component system response regulator HydG
MANNSTPLRVLVVDDEPLIVWSLSETLAGCGEIVSDAATREGTVRSLEAMPEPDVVLLDYQLPDSFDLGLLSTVRRLAPHSQVILMSAYRTPQMTRDALAIGAYRVIDKPIDMREVPALVREAADSRPH